MFLAVQPLFMQVISLFVVGYIARKLGKADFGIFNFVVAFSMLFYPVAILGLNRITVRDLANQANPAEYARRMVTLRIAAVLFATGLIIAVAHAVGYPDRTVIAIYWAVAIFILQLLSEAITDIFNAHQKMEFTALTGLVAGLTLTGLSVVVLYLGYGLFELLGVYVAGQFLGLIVATIILVHSFFRYRPVFDWSFSKVKLKEGFQFFLMTMMWFAMMRVDTVLLSKKVTMEDLGLYTSALLLVTKLSFIPHAISNALLPAFAKAHTEGGDDEIAGVFRSFITKIILLALPCVLTVSYYADHIVTIIFGHRFDGAGSILKIGIWAFLFTCIAFCQFSMLAATHRQNLLLRAYLISGVYCVIANIGLIHYLGTLGAVLAFTTTQVVLFGLFTYFSISCMGNLFHRKSLSKILLLNILVYLLFHLAGERMSMWGAVPVAALLYILGAGALNLLRMEDFRTLKSVIRPV